MNYMNISFNEFICCLNLNENNLLVLEACQTSMFFQITKSNLI